MTAQEARNLTFFSALNSDFYKRCIERVRKRCEDGAHDAYIECSNTVDFNMRSELMDYFTSKGFTACSDDDNEGLVLRW